MDTSRAGVDGTLTSRYECKYFVSEQVASEIRQYVRPFLSLDPFSERSRDHKYSVYSLYFDSPGFRLYQDTIEGARNRFKLRLRYYDELGEGPVFAEVKKRNDQIVRKTRDRLDVATLAEVGSGQVHAISNEFMERMMAVGARPTMRIRYRREAWECRGNSPVRVTFDTDLEHSLPTSPGLRDACPAWQTTPLDGIVLEIKFTQLRPLWLNHMIAHFQLDKQSIAKYVMSVDRARDSGEIMHHFARTAVTPNWHHSALR
jgi:SPX domain protein involved in polyphosphate accumulation